MSFILILFYSYSLLHFSLSHYDFILFLSFISCLFSYISFLQFFFFVFVLFFLSFVTFPFCFCDAAFIAAVIALSGIDSLKSEHERFRGAGRFVLFFL